jgi:hypothetical protein
VLEVATLHWLEIIGEAANRVSEDVRFRHPDVPWRAIIDFRNLLDRVVLGRAPFSVGRGRIHRRLIRSRQQIG